MFTFLFYVILTICAVAYAEFAGYSIHRLLHMTPEWFEERRWAKPFKFICVQHMWHHGVAYGPRMPQRPSEEYAYLRNSKDGEHKQSKWGWFPVEFVLPSLFAIALYAGLLLLFGLSLFQIVYMFVVTGLWVFGTFNIVHDTFHKDGHWLTRVPVLRVWFRKARENHDLHHSMIEEDGMIHGNFGISTDWMDRIYGTVLERPRFLVHKEPLGQMVLSPYEDKLYRNFYKTYEIEEPPLHKFVTHDKIHLIQDYQSAIDRKVTQEPQFEQLSQEHPCPMDDE